MNKHVLNLFWAILIVSNATSQSIVSVSPNSGPSGGTTDSVTVIGNNTFWNTGAGIYYVRLVNGNDTIGSFIHDIISDTEVTCSFFSQSSVPTGCYDVQTFDLIAGVVTLNCGFTITSGGSGSQLISISPNTGTAGGITDTVRIEGVNTFWNTGAGLYYVRLIGYGDTIQHFTSNIIDDTHWEGTFFLPDSAINGCYDVQTYDLITLNVTEPCGFTIMDGTVGNTTKSQVSPEITIFPNPAKGSIVIDIPNKSKVLLSILNINGQEVRSLNFSASKKIHLDVENLDAGMYFVHLRTEEGVITKKLLIE